jgi:uncharacterized membrane protein YoaK (UPF0700 family)
LLCALVITGVYYLAARMVFTHDRKEWPDYDAYYFTHRYWVIGGVMPSNLLLAAGQLALGSNPFVLPINIVLPILFYTQGIALMLIRSRPVSIAILVLWLLEYPASAIYSVVTS